MGDWLYKNYELVSGFLVILLLICMLLSAVYDEKPEDKINNLEHRIIELEVNND